VPSQLIAGMSLWRSRRYLQALFLTKRVSHSDECSTLRRDTTRIVGMGREAVLLSSARAGASLVGIAVTSASKAPIVPFQHTVSMPVSDSWKLRIGPESASGVRSADPRKYGLED
jgi:hypothetical protein